MKETYIPNSALLPIQVPLKLPQTFFPTRGLRVGDRTDFVQEVPLGLQCQTMIWAICVVEDVSITSGPSVFGVLGNLGASSILT